MGIFDRSDRNPETFELPKKSHHHYVLAHVALRTICLQNPYAFFGVMASPERDDFLQSVWQMVRRNCDPEGPPSFDIADVGITTCRIRDFPAIIVTMPPPADVPEAYFVGMVLKVDGKKKDPPAHPEVAYLTLERGIQMDGAERTVLCGWSGDAHYNYGESPPATEADFIRAIEKKL